MYDISALIFYYVKLYLLKVDTCKESTNVRNHETTNGKTNGPMDFCFGLKWLFKSSSYSQFTYLFLYFTFEILMLLPLSVKIYPNLSPWGQSLSFYLNV